VLAVFVAPELDHSAQVKLAYHFVLLQKSVHVRFKAFISIYTFAIELDFDEAIGVGSNYEVYFGPVDHYHFLDVVHHVSKLPWSQALHGLVVLRRPEVTGQELVFGEPLGPLHVFLRRLVGIVFSEIGHHIVFLLVLWQEAVMIFPGVMIHSVNKGQVVVVCCLSIVDNTLLALLFQKGIVRVREPFEV